MATITTLCYYIFLFTLLMTNFSMPCLSITPPDHATDHSALLALKAFITSDPNKIIKHNWSDSSSVCSWIGVTCGSRHRRVVALNMSEMDVGGTIPPHLGNLSFLRSLDLRYNHFRGSLPQELSHLFRLKFLSLRANNFVGKIPLWLGLLDKLEYLSLGNNSISGIIPQELGKLQNLQYLSVSYNLLSGSIPSAIFNLSRLTYMALSSNKLSGNLATNMCPNLPYLENLYVYENQLNGQIPSNLSDCSYLKVVSLYGNGFSGQIPCEIGKLNLLEALDLSMNNLSGIIPEDIYNVSSLRNLYLWRNKLTGNLSNKIGNLSLLKNLGLGENNLTGVIPQEICLLSRAENLVLRNNKFVGKIPQGLFNITTIQIIGLEFNGFVDTLPTSLGYGLPALEVLSLGHNYITGVIPNSISNCSKLRTLSLYANKFTGFVPSTLGSLQLLESLLLHENNITTESSSSELSFISALSNCKSLKELAIGDNPLNGIIPISIGNFSTSLQYLYASNCKIKGIIPVEIGNLTTLIKLSLDFNQLTGTLPVSIKYLHKLQGLFLRENKIRGVIPEGLCELDNLDTLILNGNQFSGVIPECLGNITSLRYIYLENNMLNSSIPSKFGLLKDLLELDLSSNFLSGNLPEEIGNLERAISINLSMNQISGYIPNAIGQLLELAYLSLKNNKLQGFIPETIKNMISLETLDLSYNNLFGSIPMSLQELKYLEDFNVSFNALTGEIPTGGPFQAFTVESFKGNKGLCGSPRFDVPPCKVRSSKWKSVHYAISLFASVIACITVVSVITTLMIRYRRKEKATNGNDVLTLRTLERISYYELLRATEQFAESNLLGIGSFGSVYKGTFRDGNVFAVKVFNFQFEGSFTSFDLECQVLRNIRHRNLNKIIGSCSNDEFKALVLEYMPNGSLGNLLYSRNDCQLDVMQRLSIMVDVAFALEYLHHGCPTPIVHCDVKPSNVLLDEEMVAHVSDFGIAKLLGEEESIAHTNTLATLGYIAPEYGSEGLVSTRCDVYSYGIMLMETFTRKRPCDEIFSGDADIKSWVQASLHEDPSLVVDVNLLNLTNLDKTLKCILDILDLALNCSAENPRERINMMQVVAELQKIKAQFHV